MSNEIKTVLISSLVQDKRFQARTSLNDAVVQRYALNYQNNAPFPPVKVAMVKGAAVLVDGWHRVAALKSINRTTVEAEVFKATQSDAVWMAMMANLSHGLPLKTRERTSALRKALTAYIKAKRHRKGKELTSLKSYREIADDFEGQVRHTTIRNWMIADHPDIAELMGDKEGKYGDGGLQRNDEAADSFAVTAHDAIENALAAFQGVTCPISRGNLITKMEAALQRMKDGGEWVIEVEDF